MTSVYEIKHSEFAKDHSCIYSGGGQIYCNPICGESIAKLVAMAIDDPGRQTPIENKLAKSDMSSGVECQAVA